MTFLQFLKSKIREETLTGDFAHWIIKGQHPHKPRGVRVTKQMWLSYLQELQAQSRYRRAFEYLWREYTETRRIV